MKALGRFKKTTVTSFICISAALTLALSGCSGTQNKAESSPKKMDKVSLILDWTPNTNHTGIYVAIKQGLYKKAGIDLDIKGYSQSGAETVLANGGADFAMSYLDGLAAANAAGGKLKMVYNLQQRSSNGAAVRADSNIKRPRDLDGKIWAAASAADKGRRMKQMIINDGGKGDFKTVTVGTGAYEAVANGRADFAEGLSTWEGIEFDLQGKPLRFFYPQDYGVESTPCNMGIATSDKLIKANPGLVKRFIQASMQGYNYALNHPDKAAQILIDLNPQAKLNPELVKKSQEMLSKGFWKDSRGETGLANLQAWQKYLDYLANEKIILDANGKPLKQPQQAKDMVTNEFVK